MNEKTVASIATASWRCPAIAWASQFVIGPLIRSASAELYILAAVAQAVLVGAGLVLGIVALIAVSRGADEDARRPAIAGILFSAVTIIIVVLAFKLGGVPRRYE
jgi:F0F1-type ATP synthase membrane subunit c/vacuolar-type H+-ATPase subunit K